MPRFVYTQEMLDFIEVNYKEVGVEEIRARFFFKFGIDKSRAAIQSCIKNHNFKCGRKTGDLNKGRLKAYTREQFEWIEENYKTHSRKELHSKFNQVFNENKSMTSLVALLKNHGIKSGRTGQFKKGNVPHPNARPTGPNKTSFKKGHTPMNHRPVGSERTTVDGFIEIKTAEPATWEHKHRHIWKQAHGEIPEGYIVFHKNGDKSRNELENLVLLSRSELLRINHMAKTDGIRYIEMPEDIQPTLIAIAKLADKTHKISKGAE